jgi:biopolymer transport protein TolQ
MTKTLVASVFSGSIWKILGETSAFGVFILAILLFMSLVSWAIIFQKWRLFKAVEKDSVGFSQHFRRCRMLGEVAGQAKSYHLSPLSGIYLAGIHEVDDLKKKKNQGGGLQEKMIPLDSDDFEILEMAMERTLTQEVSKLEGRVVFLATTGSSAPFMGLLGTVVGIMDSFWAIGERGSASLAVVAPGIAEALLATIVGLGAAIPAVIAYNWSNNRIKGINDRAYGFMLDFIARARKETT